MSSGEFWLGLSRTLRSRSGPLLGACVCSLGSGASQVAADVCCLTPGPASCEPVNTDLVMLARDCAPRVTTNESRGEAGAPGFWGIPGCRLLRVCVREASGCLGGWGSLELSCGVALLPGLRASQNIPTPNSIALLPMLAKKED